MKKVAIIVGSESDKDQMDKGIEVLKQFDIRMIQSAVAHRNPDALHDHIKSLIERICGHNCRCGNGGRLPDVWRHERCSRLSACL